MLSRWTVWDWRAQRLLNSDVDADGFSNVTFKYFVEHYRPPLWLRPFLRYRYRQFFRRA